MLLRSRHERDFIAVFERRVRYGKMPVHGDLHPVGCKGLAPAILPGAQPCQQGFDIGDRRRQLDELLVPAGQFRQLDEIQQPDGNLAARPGLPAPVVLPAMRAQCLQIALPVAFIVEAQVVQGIPGAPG